VLTSSSGRRSFLHLFRIAIAVILILLLILNIAFYGRYSDLALHPSSAYGLLDNYNWLLRSFGTGAAFYVIYLLAMIAVTIISIFSRSVSEDTPILSPFVLIS
jgi:phosphoglycerol transferase MdoB-like AlkP superfamily enzyme